MPHEEFVPVDGGQLWTVTTGSGPGLVLAHGGPGWSDNLEPVAGMLDDVARVHRYDQRACGRSTGSDLDLTVQSAVADLEALRKHWGYQRWIVGGHSWGAFLALAYTLTHPERVRAVLYLAGPGPTPTVSPATPTRMQRLTPAEQRAWAAAQAQERQGDADAAARSARFFWRTDYADPRRAPDFNAHPLYRYPRNRVAADALNASRERWVADGGLRSAKDLAVPVLMLHGRSDPLPVEGAHAWAQLLPHHELVVLDDVGHVPWLEDHAAVRIALQRFMGHLHQA